VERVKRLQRELLSEEGRKLPPDQQRAKLLRLMKDYRDLPFDQRKALVEQSKWRRVERQRLRAFARASPAQRRAQLDEDIKRQERIKDWLGWLRQAEKARQRSTGKDARPGAAPGHAGLEGAASVDVDQLLRWRKELLDLSTPEERAQRSFYFQMLSQRRRELGLTDLPSDRPF
jgi:hypothetical protein